MLNLTVKRTEALSKRLLIQVLVVAQQEAPGEEWPEVQEDDPSQDDKVLPCLLFIAALDESDDREA